MKSLRPILLVWIFIAVVSSVSVGKNPSPLAPELQRVLTHAKSVYLISGHVEYPKTKHFIKTEMVDSTPFAEPLHKEFEKWGRFTLAPDAKSADLIVRAYMTGSTQSVAVFTPGVTGSVDVGATFIVLDVVQPSTRRILWSESRNSGRSWSTNTGVSRLVKDLRKFIEQQETTQVSELSQAPVANFATVSRTPAQCIAFDKVNSQSAPPELYRSVGQCIQSDDYSSALSLFVLAGMDTRFDMLRVADNTARDAGMVLMRNTFESVPAEEQKKFNNAIRAVSADNSVRDYLCGWTQQAGPPSYYPTYMIMHGMHAVTAGLTKTPLQQELLPVPDAPGTWRKIGASYLHCPLAEQNVSSSAEQGSDLYRKKIERAVAALPAQTASGMRMAKNSSSANGNGARPDQQDPAYGPLTFNSEGADFYVEQDGKFAPASVSGGAIEVHLHPSSFQIGYNGEQMNVCLAQSPFPEMRADPRGYKASCLSGPFTGAREPNSDVLLVYGGQKWNDGNTELSDATSMKATAMKGFRSAYQVNQLQFVDARDMTLSRFKGTLYGYIAVYKQHVRSNKDIMPIRLIFE